MHYAVTGGIASGKTWFCNKLRGHGNEVYSCDEAAKRIIRTDPQVREALKALVAGDLYLPDGTLQKRVLAAYLTASPDHAARVNAIVHPKVADDYLRWQRAQTTQHTFMECALLFESGFDRLAERSICIYASEAVRLRRLMRRDGISAEQARRWMSLQMPEEEKRRRADIVIYNDKDC
ncbi:MAG: dephospho-CoA kinase [Bacteroidaceae bacterium]|nr:dephospho-CoA kinase [Bacteroidaceae bacterium]